MEAPHFEEIMQSFQQRTPFRPFTVSLVNGRRYEVDHSNALVVREGVAVYLGPGGVPVIFDHEGVSEVTGDIIGLTTTE